MLTAKDVMTREVQTVSSTTEISELARRFVETGLGTFPVLDADGKICGIVSESDLLRQQAPIHIPRVTALFDWVFYLESEKKFQQEVQRITARTVGEICSREIVSCAPDTSVAELAGLMTSKKIHLVPVLEGEQLLGVVARVDLLRAFGG